MRFGKSALALEACGDGCFEKEEIVITRRGRRWHASWPAGVVTRDRLAGTVARLKAFRRGRRLGDLSANALIEEGR